MRNINCKLKYIEVDGIRFMRCSYDHTEGNVFYEKKILRQTKGKTVGHKYMKTNSMNKTNQLKY